MFVPIDRTGAGPSHALGLCRVFESVDLDDARERISRIMQPHELKPISRSRRAAYQMNYLSMPSMGMGTISLGGMQVDVGSVDGYHLLIFCIRGQARIVRNGSEIEISSSKGVCLAPGDAFRGEFSADCEQLVFKIDPCLLDAYAGRRNSRLGPVFELDKHMLRPWVNVVGGILQDPAAVEIIRRDDRVASDYQQLMASLLVSGQGLLEPAPPGIGAAPASVHRAEMFIRAHYTNPLSLEDIALACGASPRTLLDNFRKFRQTSPMRFLRDIRLDAVREDIRRCADTNVSTLAMNAGFGHLGRFARDYKDRFGEAPSGTRRRARKAPAKT